MPKQHIQRSNRAGRGYIKDLVDPPFDDELGDPFQVGERDQRKTAWFECPLDFGQGLRHLEVFQVLEIVRGPDGIHAAGFDGRHFGDAGNDVWLDGWIDIQSDFLPATVLKAFRQACPVGFATADVKQGPGLVLIQTGDEAGKVVVGDLHVVLRARGRCGCTRWGPGGCQSAYPGAFAAGRPCWIVRLFGGEPPGAAGALGFAEDLQIRVVVPRRSCNGLWGDLEL